MVTMRKVESHINQLLNDRADVLAKLGASGMKLCGAQATHVAGTYPGESVLINEDVDIPEDYSDDNL